MLTWDWKDKIGELKLVWSRNDDVIESNISIYKGNALMIFIHEREDDTYSLFNFFVDMPHLNNCLKKKSIFEGWQEIKLFEYDKDVAKAALKIFEKHGVDVRFTPFTLV